MVTEDHKIPDQLNDMSSVNPYQENAILEIKPEDSVEIFPDKPPEVEQNDDITDPMPVSQNIFQKVGVVSSNSSPLTMNASDATEQLSKLIGPNDSLDQDTQNLSSSNTAGLVDNTARISSMVNRKKIVFKKRVILYAKPAECQPSGGQSFTQVTKGSKPDNITGQSPSKKLNAPSLVGCNGSYVKQNTYQGPQNESMIVDIKRISNPGARYATFPASRPTTRSQTSRKYVSIKGHSTNQIKDHVETWPPDQNLPPTGEEKAAKLITNPVPGKISSAVWRYFRKSGSSVKPITTCILCGVSINFKGKIHTCRMREHILRRHPEKEVPLLAKHRTGEEIVTWTEDSTPGRKVSVVWRYFRKSGSKVKPTTTCNICGDKFSYKSRNTGTMTKHLQNTHPELEIKFVPAVPLPKNPKSGRKSSPVWKYFEESGSKEKPTLVCNICGHTICFNTKKNYISHAARKMKTHLKFKHSDLVLPHATVDQSNGSKDLSEILIDKPITGSLQSEIKPEEDLAKMNEIIESDINGKTQKGSGITGKENIFLHEIGSIVKQEQEKSAIRPDPSGSNVRNSIREKQRELIQILKNTQKSISNLSNVSGNTLTEASLHSETSDNCSTTRLLTSRTPQENLATRMPNSNVLSSEASGKILDVETSNNVVYEQGLESPADMSETGEVNKDYNNDTCKTNETVTHDEKANIRQQKTKSTSDSKVKVPVGFVCSSCYGKFPSWIAFHNHSCMRNQTKVKLDPAVYQKALEIAGQRKSGKTGTKASANENDKSYEKTHTCEVCGRSYLYIRELNSHRLTHGPPIFICEYCGYQCHTNQMYQIHIRYKHTKLKPFKCMLSNCGRRFVTKSALNTHMAYHGSARKFECALCKKKFKTKHTLQQHSKVHLPPKHKCRYCPKTFTFPQNMRTHIKNVHQGAQYASQKVKRERRKGKKLVSE